MAKKKPKVKKAKEPRVRKPLFVLSNQQKLIFGSFFLLLGILLFIAFLSFLFTGKADQSIISELPSRAVETENWASQVGAWLSDFFIQRGFGISAFIFAGLVFLSGVFTLLDLTKAKLIQHWFWGTLIALWISTLSGFAGHKNDILSGTIGFEVNTFIQDFIGKVGTVLLLIFGLITYLAIRFKVTPERIINAFKKAKKDIKSDFKDVKNDVAPLDNNLSAEADDIKSAFKLDKDKLEPTLQKNARS